MPPKQPTNQPLNLFSAIMQMTKFTSAKFLNMFHPVKLKEKNANTADLDEAAHYELLHQDLHCLQIQL